MKSRVTISLLLSLALLALGARAGNHLALNPVKSLPSVEQSVRATLATTITLEWYKLTLELVRHTPTYSPPVAARAFGYLGVSLFETVAARSTGLRSLAGQLNGLPAMPQPSNDTYDEAVMVHGALSSAIAALFANTGPSGQRALEFSAARLLKEVSAGLPAEVVTRSLEYGQRVSKTVLDWAATDGGAVIDNLGFPMTYPKASSPAEWTPTSSLGTQQTPLLPNWGNNRPLVMKTGNACPLSAPPAYSVAPDSAFYQEALEVYTTTKNLTQNQRDIAAFWSDDAMLTFTPPGHWVAILTDLLEARHATLETLAEGYARLGLAVADGFIGCWYTKFQYKLLRPVTYIQRVIDAKWTPLLATPPFPEYPSGHSTQSGAAATVLTAFLGDNLAFTDHTHDDDGLEPRSFKSFWGAANEAGISRLYGGIHFRSAIELGLEQGRCIGQQVNRLQFKK